jgi:hypothetical protein
MLTSIHFLLTYACNFTCDHCFLYSGPQAKGTFTIALLKEMIDQAAQVPGIESVCFEGGEPFLYYPVMVEGIHYARQLGLKTGVVSNAYWATSPQDARLWLQALADLGVGNISVSDDSLHFGDEQETPAKHALAAGKAMNLSMGSLCTEKPMVKIVDGKRTVAGSTLFKGRAVEKLIGELPRRPWQELVTCPHETMADPSRVHLDAYGFVHLCQGLCMGNALQTPLRALLMNYRAAGARAAARGYVRGRVPLLLPAPSSPHRPFPRVPGAEAGLRSVEKPDWHVWTEQ